MVSWQSPQPVGKTQAHNLVRSGNLGLVLEVLVLSFPTVWAQKWIPIWGNPCLASFPGALRFPWGGILQMSYPHSPHLLLSPFLMAYLKPRQWLSTCSDYSKLLTNDFEKITVPITNPPLFTLLHHRTIWGSSRTLFIATLRGNTQDHNHVAFSFHFTSINWALLMLCLLYTRELMKLKWILQKEAIIYYYNMMQGWFI